MGLLATEHHFMPVPHMCSHCMQVVRQTLVAPAVQAALATAAAGRAPGAAAGADGLAAVLPPMLATILDRCAAPVCLDDTPYMGTVHA